MFVSFFLSLAYVVPKGMAFGAKGRPLKISNSEPIVQSNCDNGTNKCARLEKTEAQDTTAKPKFDDSNRAHKPR